MYVALVAIYGGFTSSPAIILKPGAPALVALIYFCSIIGICCFWLKLKLPLFSIFRLRDYFLFCGCVVLFLFLWLPGVW